MTPENMKGPADASNIGRARKVDPLASKIGTTSNDHLDARQFAYEITRAEFAQPRRYWRLSRPSSKPLTVMPQRNRIRAWRAEEVRR